MKILFLAVQVKTA